MTGPHLVSVTLSSWFLKGATPTKRWYTVPTFFLLFVTSGSVGPTSLVPLCFKLTCCCFVVFAYLLFGLFLNSFGLFWTFALCSFGFYLFSLVYVWFGLLVCLSASWVVEV